MKLEVVGLNHRTAPLQLREKLAFSEENIPKALLELKKMQGVQEAVLLSTCNRVELYIVTSSEVSVPSLIGDYFAQFHRIAKEEFESHLYFYKEREALEHGVKVASGIDSMVVGESQILGQMKQAYQAAQRHHTTGPFLNVYFNRLFNLSKKIRTSTGLGMHSLSIGSIAVQLAEKIFGDLGTKVVLMIGAGKMGDLTSRYFKRQGISEIWITNRNFEKAKSMADACEGKSIHFDDFLLSLPMVDIVVTSTAANHFILKPETIRQSMELRKNRPMFLIDLSVPRNIDPAIEKIYNVYLYDIDTLQTVAASHYQERKSAVQEALKLIQEEGKEIQHRLKTLHRTPLIQSLTQKMENIRLREVEKAFSLSKEWTAEQKMIVEECTSAIVRKFLHDPLLFLKNSASVLEEGRGEGMIEEIFNLGPKTEDDEAEVKNI